MPRVSHRQVLGFLWTYARRQLPMLGAMLVLLIVSTGCFLAQPFFYKQAIDAISAGHAGDASVWRASTASILIGIGIAGIGLLLEQIAALMLARVESRLMRQMHADVTHHVQQLSTDFHVNSFAGSTARKIGRGVEAMENVLDRVWFNFLPTLAIMIGYLVVLGHYAPVMALTILVGMIVSIVLGVILNTVLARYQTWTDEQDTALSGNLVDTLTGNPLVKSYAAEKREDERHGRFLAEWQHRVWTTWSVATFTTILQFTALVALEAILLCLAVWLWYVGTFTPGDFIVIMLYVGQLWGRLWDIGRNIRDYMKSIAHCEEMVEVALQPVVVSDKPDAKPLVITKGAVSIRDVTFHYEKKPKPVFDHFSLDIAPGEKVALVGHSGGGKSTFVKLLMRLYDVQQGTVEIDGQDIAHVTQQSLRSTFALVPQDPILFHRTIAENIAYAKPDATLEDIRRAASLAHASEFIEKLPQTYETLVGERGVKLSGGERQRVAIARAILADRPILILDEATSSLDSQSESLIQDALGPLMEGRTTVVIAHRLSTIKRVDRIVVIEHGAVAEQGTHAELLKKEGGIYRGLYELQAGGFIGE